MKNRQPLFHVVKRENTGPGLQMLTYVAAAALALARRSCTSGMP